MKKKLSREFKIGAFGLAMIGLLYFSINFIKSNRVFSSDKTYYAVFESADGLEVSAPVMAKGFRIGTVEHIKFDLEKQDITVTFTVEKEYPLAMGSTVKIASESLMGGQIIEVNFAQNTQKYNNKDTVKSIFEPGLMQMVSAEYGALRSKLSGFAEKLDQIMTGLSGAVDPQNVENLKVSMANLNTISGDISSMLHNKRGNIENIIANLDSLSRSLKNIMPKVGNAVGNIEKASESMPMLLINASMAIGNLNAMLAKVNSGEGTLGKIVSDEELYTTLSSTVDNLNLLLTDIKENPKRYINIRVFGKSYEEKQAEKQAKEADRQAKKAKK